MNKLTKLALLSVVFALPDVRLAPKQQGAPKDAVDRVPDTYDYKGIEKQEKNDNDQFLRSNIDNEANKRNEKREFARDMLPCRQDKIGERMKFTRGVAAEFPLRWNNPHDSDCEVNIFVDGLTQVAPIKRPTNCGGGYQNERFKFTIPSDFPAGKCETAAEKCVLQVYGHSVEPRTYAMCIDFTLTPGVKGPNKVYAKDVGVTRFQPAKHYHDSFDTSHVDSSHSGYRGQQPRFIRTELACAIILQSFSGNGGLVPLGNINESLAKKTRASVQKVIKAAEKEAIERNKDAQKALDKEAKMYGTPKKCFEGELYNIVNNPKCERKYKNTYVTNVGYCQILKSLLPFLKSTGLTQYAPKRKAVTQGLVTAFDPYGQFKNNGKPSLVPKGKDPKKYQQPKTPYKFPAGQPDALTRLASQSKPAKFVQFGKKVINLIKKLGGKVNIGPYGY